MWFLLPGSRFHNLHTILVTQRLSFFFLVWERMWSFIEERPISWNLNSLSLLPFSTASYVACTPTWGLSSNVRFLPGKWMMQQKLCLARWQRNAREILKACSAILHAPPGRMRTSGNDTLSISSGGKIGSYAAIRSLWWWLFWPLGKVEVYSLGSHPSLSFYLDWFH